VLSAMSARHARSGLIDACCQTATQGRKETSDWTTAGRPGSSIVNCPRCVAHLKILGFHCARRFAEPDNPVNGFTQSCFFDTTDRMINKNDVFSRI